MTYAASVIQPDTAFFHPHHILYNGAMRMAFLGAAPWLNGPDARLRFLQYVNISLSALLPVVVYAVCMTIGVQILLSLGSALLFGLSSAFSVYSSQIEVYNVTALCLSLAVLGLTTRGGWRGLLVPAGYALAMCFHQTALFFGLAILITHLLAAEKQRMWMRLLRDLVVPLLAVGTVCAVVGTSLGHASPRALWAWLTTYAHLGIWGTTGLSIQTLRAAWIGGRSAFIDSPGHLQNYLLVVLLGLYVAVSLVGEGKRTIAERKFVVALLAWWIVSAVFNVWWDGGNREFWILPTLAAVVLLAAIDGGGAGMKSLWVRSTRSVMLILCLPLLLTSYVMHYRSNQRPNEFRATALVCAEVMRDGDMMLAVGGDRAAYYRVYLIPRRIDVATLNGYDVAGVALRRGTQEAFTRALLDVIAERIGATTSRGGRAFVDSWIQGGDLPTTRLVRDLDVPAFMVGLDERFVLEPVHREGGALIYRVLAKKSGPGPLGGR